MTRLITIALLLISFFSFSKNEINEDEVEIGIVEKLNDTIPLDLTFFNESNDTISLKELIDKPTVLSFVYFDCPGICSPLMTGIADVVEKLEMDLGKDYQIITISFNTKDTPEKAKIKKENFVNKISQENRSNWIYLTGEQDNITKVTDATGFKYKPQGLDFAHPGALIILSPKGVITRYLYGISYLPFDLKMALVEAQKGISRPSINRILEFCFTYNNNSKTYTLQITRIFGSIIAIIALIIFVNLLIKGRKKQK